MILQTILLVTLLLMAITFHEAAHAYAAKACGDKTAFMLGRTSFNPLRHIDPVGTVLVPALFFLGGMTVGTQGLIFGWAKPVPVRFDRLNNPVSDTRKVAAAGPLANLLLALASWAGLFLLASLFDPNDSLLGVGMATWYQVLIFGIIININLMLLNLLPILPLDGGRILSTYLKYPYSAFLAKTESYGIFIVLALFLTGLWQWMMSYILRLFFW